jgi:hypothetical protein
MQGALAIENVRWVLFGDPDPAAKASKSSKMLPGGANATAAGTAPALAPVPVLVRVGDDVGSSSSTTTTTAVNEKLASSTEPTGGSSKQKEKTSCSSRKKLQKRPRDKSKIKPFAAAPGSGDWSSQGGKARYLLRFSSFEENQGHKIRVESAIELIKRYMDSEDQSIYEELELLIRYYWMGKGHASAHSTNADEAGMMHVGMAHHYMTELHESFSCDLGEHGKRRVLHGACLASQFPLLEPAARAVALMTPQIGCVADSYLEKFMDRRTNNTNPLNKMASQVCVHVYTCAFYVHACAACVHVMSIKSGLERRFGVISCVHMIWIRRGRLSRT